MPRIITATEAKTHMGAILDWTVEHEDEVIIQAHGQPKAVLISFAAYQKNRNQQEIMRRQAALARLEALAQRQEARNPDLGQTEAEALVDRFSRDAFAEMVAEGRIQYGG